MNHKPENKQYSITPLYLGCFPKYEKSTLLYMIDCGTKVKVPSFSFLIRGADKNIIVDTGPGKAEEVSSLHPGLVLDFPEDINIITALEKEGLTPKDIDYIIYTHLHWDHCYNGKYFPGKKMYVQKKEMEYALAPLPLHGSVYESPIVNMTPPWFEIKEQFELVDGDVELEDGIKLIFTPGHTPGSQGVLVRTKDGPAFIAGDTVMVYENWTGIGSLKHIYTGVHVNLCEYELTFKKIEGLDAEIIPSHDFSILDKK